MYINIITPKLNSTFGKIGKAKDIKMTTKVVSKNSNFCISMKKILNMWSWSEARLQNFEQFFTFK